jgi:predicted negative regulator of RcsB-dependent stress response
MAAIDEALKGGGDASYAQDALAMRSDILARQGKYDEALRSYKELAERASSDDNRTLAQLGALRVAKQMGNWNEVKNLSGLLLDRGGLTVNEEKEVTLDRALSLAQMGNTKDAETAFRTLAKDPTSEYSAQASLSYSARQVASDKSLPPPQERGSQTRYLAQTNHPSRPDEANRPQNG